MASDKVADYAHRLNPETPVEETMRALAQLQREGKIKHIGLSGVSADTLRRACKITHVAAIQMVIMICPRFVPSSINADTHRNIRRLCWILKDPVAFSKLAVSWELVSFVIRRLEEAWCPRSS